MLNKVPWDCRKGREDHDRDSNAEEEGLSEEELIILLAERGHEDCKKRKDTASDKQNLFEISGS
jgi:hypothetical protein